MWISLLKNKWALLFTIRLISIPEFFIIMGILAHALTTIQYEIIIGSYLVETAIICAFYSMHIED